MLDRELKHCIKDFAYTRWQERKGYTLDQEKCAIIYMLPQYQNWKKRKVVPPLTCPPHVSPHPLSRKQPSSIGDPIPTLTDGVRFPKMLIRPLHL